MQYNFDRDFRRVLAHARTESIELGHDYVAPEHMLLGMLRVEECRGTQLLANLGLLEDEVRAEAAGVLEPGQAEVGPGELPYTTRAKKVLELAMAAARDLQDRHVGTEHLLLGMLRDRKGMAAHILGGVGVTPSHVEDLLAGEVPPPREPLPTAAMVSVEARLGIEIDDGSNRSIYEQIVARVKEAVAVGQVSAGERLPPVRRLADQLDIAPGTVARAYSELERLGVVVTEGARGTRVADPTSQGAGSAMHIDRIAGLLRPAAVAAFHMGSGADDLRRALERAMEGIFRD
ncbi:MAG: GntR family transcriptional regulator [Gemmatimonadales bacterium]|nr:MAG: GntR family transcriptional regulator [Gemmatimonadales bacterium]